MHTFLDDFHQDERYSAQITSHQSDLRREETFTGQKSLPNSALQTDYLNLDSRSGFEINTERASTVQKKCTFCGGANHSEKKCFKRIRKEKEKSHAAGDSDNRRTERMPQKKFTCVSEDHLIAKFPKPQKDNKKRQKQVLFNEKGYRACDNGKNTKRYMHLWHVCLVTKNVLVEILVTVCN